MVAPPAKVLRRLALAGGALLALACGHTDPFSTPPYGTNQPFDPTPPVRLTLNPAADRGASWLPDGSGILYSAQQPGRPDVDVCLAELPPDGGSQRWLVCDGTPAGPDLTDAIESPVRAPDGPLAFVKASGAIGGSNPSSEALAVASGVDIANATDLQRIPYTLAGEPTHTGITQIRWQRPGRLVYLAQSVVYRRACAQCRLDTIASGLKVALLDLSPPGTAPVVLPATDFASGVSPGPSSDEVYYTLGGDTRVYRRSLSTGSVGVVHDFGAAGIARDVHVAGGRLTAVVGGRVALAADPLLGPTQYDSGGIVHLVDLGTDEDRTLDDPSRLFRRPVLAPSGDRIVAEGYPLIVTDVFDAVTQTNRKDTTVDRAADLYLFAAP
ncbi:MAG: hypothetical protein ABIQ49_01885 [Gemmatimonadales bacterium]